MNVTKAFNTIKNTIFGRKQPPKPAPDPYAGLSFQEKLVRRQVDLETERKQLAQDLDKLTAAQKRADKTEKIAAAINYSSFGAMALGAFAASSGLAAPLFLGGAVTAAAAYYFRMAHSGTRCSISNNILKDTKRFRKVNQELADLDKTQKRAGEVKEEIVKNKKALVTPDDAKDLIKKGDGWIEIDGVKIAVNQKHSYLGRIFG